jgi:energy-coupling factor transport system permease protein
LTRSTLPGGHGLLFTRGTSRLHRANPLTKLAALVWAISAAAILPTPGTTLLTLAAVAFAFPMGVGRTVVTRLVVTLAPLALALAVVHGCLIPRPDAAALGPFTLSRAGLAFAAAILARLAAILAASLLFVTTTHPGDLLRSLDACGIPPGLSYLIASPLLLIEPLANRANEIRDAQAARGLDLTGSWRARIYALPALLVPLVTLALTDLDHRAFVLTGRAFQSGRRRTVLDPPADSTAQRWLRRGLVTVAVLQIGVVRLWH